MKIVVGDDDQPVALDHRQQRRNQVQEQFLSGRLVEWRVAVREALLQRRDLVDEDVPRQEHVAHRYRAGGDVPDVDAIVSNKVLQHLVTLVAHRSLQRIEGGRLRRHQVLQTRRLDGEARGDLVMLRFERSNLSFQLSDSCRVHRGIGLTGELEQLALRVGDLRAKYRRFRKEPLFEWTSQAGLASGKKIGQRARARAFEHLERVRVAFVREQLPDRRIVKTDAVLEHGATGTIVSESERPAVAFEAIDGLQVGIERRVVLPACLVQQALDEVIQLFDDWRFDSAQTLRGTPILLVVREDRCWNVLIGKGEALCDKDVGHGLRAEGALKPSKSLLFGLSQLIVEVYGFELLLDVPRKGEELRLLDKSQGLLEIGTSAIQCLLAGLERSLHITLRYQFLIDLRPSKIRVVQLQGVSSLLRHRHSAIEGVARGAQVELV